MRKSRAKNPVRVGDPKFNDALVTRFVNELMHDGKKSTAFKIFYDTLSKIEEKTQENNGLEIWKKGLENAMPAVEVRSRRVGGSTFQVPNEVRPDRKISLGIKWIIQFARKRGEKSMVDKLSAELMQAANGEGPTIKKKEDTHRMAEANKAFSHFRFR